MLGYGSFITAIINFLIIAFVLFLAIKQIEKLKGAAPAPAEPAAPPPPPRSEVLLEQIRDALAKK